MNAQPSLWDQPATAHEPFDRDQEKLAELARAAMIRLFRRRAAAEPLTVASVSAIDLGEWFDAFGYTKDRRWSVVVFVRPNGVFRVNGTTRNPRRHGAITVTYELVESRAAELGL